MDKLSKPRNHPPRTLGDCLRITLKLLAIALALGVAAPAWADTWVFTGQPFAAVFPHSSQNCSAVPGGCVDYDATKHVTGRLTFFGPLPPNLNFAAVTPDHFSFNDSTNMISSGDPAVRVRGILVSTDGSGHLTAAVVDVSRWRDGQSGSHSQGISGTTDPSQRVDRITIGPQQFSGGENNEYCSSILGSDSCDQASIDEFTSRGSSQAAGSWTLASKILETAVSGLGSDVNDCSPSSPCATFASAVDQTAAGGTVRCLDGGEFGPVTITRSVTIACTSNTAGVLAPGTSGIVINIGSTDSVILKGLDINGAGPAASSLDGVRMVGAGSLTIMDSLIYGFRGPNSNGVNLIGANTAHILVENTIIRANTIGVGVAPASGTNSITLDRSTLEGNVTSNLVVGTNGTAVLTGSAIAGSPTALRSTGGSVISYGNNFIRNAGAPTQTLRRQ